MLEKRINLKFSSTVEFGLFPITLGDLPVSFTLLLILSHFVEREELCRSNRVPRRENVYCAVDLLISSLTYHFPGREDADDPVIGPGPWQHQDPTKPTYLIQVPK